MQPRNSHRLPPESHIYRVVGKDSFLVIVTLVKADAFAISNVYGGYYFDF